jgi:hypothetical protein
MSAGDETSGKQAHGQPRKTFSRHFGTLRPKAGIAIALQRAYQVTARDVWVEWCNHMSQLLPIVLLKPGLCASNCTHHRNKGLAIARDAVPGSEEGRID